MRKALLLVLLLLSPLTFAFSEGELITLLQTPKNVQGDFTQQRFLKSLTKPITTQGKFTLLAQKGLLWQMEKPFANQLRVKKDGIYTSESGLMPSQLELIAPGSSGYTLNLRLISAQRLDRQ